MFEWINGSALFHGLPVVREAITVAGCKFTIAGLKDAADLLDEPDFAKRFVDEDRAPYGLELWPAAAMLAEYVLCGEEGEHRHAIELGCGLGLVSIAATTKGWCVTATDSEPTSLRFAQYNAAVNQVHLDGFELLDWQHPPTGRRFDRVFGADVLYQVVDHGPLVHCVHRLLALSGVALLADPNRGIADRFASLAQERGLDVEVISTRVVAATGRQTNGRIFRLRRTRDRP